MNTQPQFALLNEEQILNFPIRHFSVSGIRSYLTDRQSFFKRYIRLEFETQKGPALVEGDMYHKNLEAYYSALKEGKQDQFDRHATFDQILDQFENVDKKFDTVVWGETGSKEKSIETVKRALNFYFTELPAYSSEQIISIEERFLTDFEDLDGNSMPIPLKSFTDLIVIEDLDKLDEFSIEDHKLVTSITPQEKVAPIFEIQACGYWFAVRKRFGINPKRMIFRQCKKSKNSVDLTIEELEVLIEQHALEFQEISEKTQLIEICKNNLIDNIDLPAITKQILELKTDDIKKILDDAKIEYKKSGKKEELIAVCAENGITETVIPATTVAIEKLTIKDIKLLLESLQINCEIRTKRTQMIDLMIDKGLLALPPQVVPYVVEYTAEMLERFLELYRRIVKELSGQPLLDESTGIVQFLPNPFASFGAEESWLDFCEEVNSGKSWTIEEIRAKKPTTSNSYDDDDVEALDI